MDEISVSKKNIPKPTNFGKNMKFLRKRKGLTQGAFAEVLGISRNSIASYENGLVEPNVLIFLKVCKFFDQDPKVMLRQRFDLIDGMQNHSREGIKQSINSSFNDFLVETREVSKVLYGYQEFYSMRRDLANNEQTKDFFLILDDLLSLLDSLISENIKLIESIEGEKSGLDNAHSPPWISLFSGT